MGTERERPFEYRGSQRGSSHDYQPPQRTPVEIMRSVNFWVKSGSPSTVRIYFTDLPADYLSEEQRNELLRSSYLNGAANMRRYAAHYQALGMSGQPELEVATKYEAAAAALTPPEQDSLS